MTRRAYVDHDKKCLLFWSPKAGCTSLVQWYVYGRLQQIRSEVLAKYHDARAWLSGEGYLLAYPEARRLAEQEGYTSVALVRHPASRVLSAYLNKFVVYHGGQLDSWDKLEPLARTQLTRWHHDPDEKGVYSGISFHEFLDNIEKAVAEAGKGVPELDPHWNLQAPRNAVDNCLKFDKVLYLEDFASGIVWLNEFFGADYKVRKTNRTRYQEGGEVSDLTAVPSVELARSMSGLKKENFLTPKTLEQIGRIYATDYELFGYDPQDLKKVPGQARVAPGEERPAPVPPEAPEAPMLPIMQKLDDDHVPYDIQDNGMDKTVIAFGGLGARIGMPVFEFRKSLAAFDCNFVFFKDVKRSWYHGDLPNFGATFEEKGNNLKSILGRLAETELYLVGSSAGGFAALMFGAFLDAKASLLFGPQVFIDPHTRQALRDMRWPRLINAIEAPDYRSVAQVGDKIKHLNNFIVGTNDEKDINHALYARAHVDTNILFLRNGGHNPAKNRKAAGILHNVLEEFLTTGRVGEYRGLKIGQKPSSLLRL